MNEKLKANLISHKVFTAGLDIASGGYTQSCAATPHKGHNPTGVSFLRGSRPYKPEVFKYGDKEYEFKSVPLDDGFLNLIFHRNLRPTTTVEASITDKLVKLQTPETYDNKSNEVIACYFASLSTYLSKPEPTLQITYYETEFGSAVKKEEVSKKELLDLLLFYYKNKYLLFLMGAPYDKVFREQILTREEVELVYESEKFNNRSHYASEDYLTLFLLKVK